MIEMPIDDRIAILATDYLDKPWQVSLLVWPAGRGAPEELPLNEGLLKDAVWKIAKDIWDECTRSAYDECSD